MGKLIVLEGIDGIGKTTQARLLYDLLVDRGYRCHLEKEPTDGNYGQQLRELFCQSQRNHHEEYRLFMADREEHVRLKIKPALQKGYWVVLDRYYFSTMAYQGALDICMDDIRKQNEQFAPSPDVVILMDMSVDLALNRIQKRIQTSNSQRHFFETSSYLNQVRKQFLQLQKTQTDIIKLIAADGDVQYIHQSIVDILKHKKMIGS